MPLFVSPSTFSSKRRWAVRPPLSIFTPVFYLHLGISNLAERIDVCRRKSSVGDQRNIIVNRCATDTVAVLQFTLRMVLRNIDDKIDFVTGDAVDNIRFNTRVWPMEHFRRNIILFQELSRSACGIQLVPCSMEGACCIQQLHLRTCGSRRDQNAFLLIGYVMSYGQHTLEQSLVIVVTQTSYLTRGSHIHTKNRVGLEQSSEREL